MHYTVLNMSSPFGPSHRTLRGYSAKFCVIGDELHGIGQQYYNTITDGNSTVIQHRRQICVIVVFLFPDKNAERTNCLWSDIACCSTGGRSASSLFFVSRQDAEGTVALDCLPHLSHHENCTTGLSPLPRLSCGTSRSPDKRIIVYPVLLRISHVIVEVAATELREMDLYVVSTVEISCIFVKSKSCVLTLSSGRSSFHAAMWSSIP